MTILSKVVAFLNTSKPEEARAFFGDKLGFPFLGDDGNALVFDVNGTKLRVTKAAAFTPAHGTVLGWEVDDVAVAVRELESRGVHFEQFGLPFLKQDELGIWTTPNGDQVAWFRDPDRNVLSVSSHKRDGA